MTSICSKFSVFKFPVNKQRLQYFVLLLFLFISLSHADDELEYVGYQTCQSCYQEQVQQWQLSHHKQAIEHANETTVLGDFNDTPFENYGLVTKDSIGSIRMVPMVSSLIIKSNTPLVCTPCSNT